MTRGHETCGGADRHAGAGHARGGFVEIPLPMLRAIGEEIACEQARGLEDTPTLYHHPNRWIRGVFWLRLRWLLALIRGADIERRYACDFGGGAGIFLPSLCAHFEQVTCIDRNLPAARKVVARMDLRNVALREEDVLAAEIADASFDCIVAADVLEHFRDPVPAVRAMRRWLKPGGCLATSLPTENLCYTILRFVFGIRKPADHYHAAAEVERMIAAHGFSRVAVRHVPLRVRLFPLFRISLWRIQPLQQATGP